MEEKGPVLERGVPSPWDVGPPDSVCLSSSKQAVASSEPNFWSHSLQSHCNGLGPKTVPLQQLFKIECVLLNNDMIFIRKTIYK